MARRLLILGTLAMLAVGCTGSTPCPPDQPCADPDGGVEFTCGNARCTGTQLCVVPATCDDPPTETSPGAQCVDLPPVCTDPRSQCSCEADVVAGGDGGVVDMIAEQCCFFAGWVPASFNICTVTCD